jgi:hypothetical protein
MSAEVQAAERRAWRAVAVAVPLLVACFHWRATLPGMAFAGSDLRYFFYAIREAVAERLRSGQLPGWQRGIFLGYPLLGDPQAATFDFATWLTLPWDAPRALTLATLLHLAVAGWGMAHWMRVRGLAPAEGLLAAVLFALGAKQTVHLLHWNFAASTAWWPWMLAGLDGFAADGRGRHLAVASLATAASWLGGSPQMAHFGTGVAGLHALALAPGLWRRRRSDAVLALASVPAGVLLAAPLLLPAVELARLGPRGAGVDYAFATSWKWPGRWSLALLLLPRAYGDGRMGLNLWEATGYLGVLPLGLAAAAPVRRRGLWLFLALAVLGVWVSFGEDAWLGLHRLLFHALPGYSAFRVPTRALMVTAFASALLAAEGLAALRRAPDAGARAKRAGAALAVSALAAAALPRLGGAERFLDPSAARAASATALILAAAALAWLALRRLGPGRAWALGAAALVGGDLLVTFGNANEVVPAASQRPPLREFTPLVPGAPEPRRVAVLAKWGTTANAPLRLGWEGATGYGPVCLQRVRSLLEATLDDRLVPPGPVAGDTNFPRGRPDSDLWPLLSAPLVISDAPQDLPRLLEGEREWESPLVGYAAPALPRVFWVGSWAVAPDRAADGPLHAAAIGDRAVLAEPLPGLGAPGPPEGPVPAEEVLVLPDALEATVVAPRPGLVVVLDPFHPGWSASVDGAPAPVGRADFAFQGVPVEAGRHRLRLVYRERLLPAGAAIALAALAALLGALAWRRRSLRRPSP